jgi:hypothetical protein
LLILRNWNGDAAATLKEEVIATEAEIRVQLIGLMVDSIVDSFGKQRRQRR